MKKKALFKLWQTRLAARKQLLKTAEQKLSYQRRKKEAASTFAEKQNRTERIRELLKLVALRKKQISWAERQVAKYRPIKLSERVAFDGAPVTRGLAIMLQDCRNNGWTGSLNSADRRKGVEKYGKSSQAALYKGWIERRPGFNPANPPGRSTHELRSDGVAYPGPVGRRLRWWQMGMDVENADGLLAVGKKLGYGPFRPYPSGSESHHINLSRSPENTLRKRGRI